MHPKCTSQRQRCTSQHPRCASQHSRCSFPETARHSDIISVLVPRNRPSALLAIAFFLDLHQRSIASHDAPTVTDRNIGHRKIHQLATESTQQAKSDHPQQSKSSQIRPAPTSPKQSQPAKQSQAVPSSPKPSQAFPTSPTCHIKAKSSTYRPKAKPK